MGSNIFNLHLHISYYKTEYRFSAKDMVKNVVVVNSGGSKTCSVKSDLIMVTGK